MPMEVLDVTKRFMRDPVRILVKKEELTLEGIKQFYVQVEKEVNDFSPQVVPKIEFSPRDLYLYICMSLNNVYFFYACCIGEVTIMTP